ncbi:MAG TPA: hypothetical protein VFL16_10570 [Steroidobacteraceae bacterium]|nr:hypothetical protein [Steroidobacteraceae bacterium]HEX5161849.1 hypothetical protein [Steroidobacteraceae bacterium]
MSLIVRLLLAAGVAWSGIALTAAGAQSQFGAGQEWTYRNEGKESEQTLIILRSGRDSNGGTAFEVAIKAVPTLDGHTMPFVFRLTRDALLRSVARLVGENRSMPMLANLPAWDENSYSFDTSIEDAIRMTQSGLERFRNEPCEFDRDRLLALDQHAFDQDLDGGWRPLGDKPQCQLVAADLLRDYRERHHNEATILIWHEGQMRALAGQTEAAIALFERCHVPSSSSGWNEYVDATIAFLKGDRKSFDAARESLAAYPKPASFDLKDPMGRPIEWPPNLNVVDELGRCFGMPYRQAYGVCPK